MTGTAAIHIHLRVLVEKITKWLLREERRLALLRGRPCLHYCPDLRPCSQGQGGPWLLRCRQGLLIRRRSGGGGHIRRPPMM
jgi:hypothetical protein